MIDINKNLIDLVESYSKQSKMIKGMVDTLNDELESLLENIKKFKETK